MGGEGRRGPERGEKGLSLLIDDLLTTWSEGEREKGRDDGIGGTKATCRASLGWARWEGDRLKSSRAEGILRSNGQMKRNKEAVNGVNGKKEFQSEPRRVSSLLPRPLSLPHLFALVNVVLFSAH